METTANTTGRQFQPNETEFSTGVSQSGGSISQLTSQAKQALHKARSRAGEEVGATMEWVEKEGVGAVESQKERLAGAIDRVVSVIDRTADQMEQEGDGTLGMYARSLSDKVHRASQYLHEQDVRRISSDVGSFLRRHSEVVIAATLIAGFAIGRFLKASGRSESGFEPDYEPDYGIGETGTIGGFGEDVESGADVAEQPEGVSHYPQRRNAGEFDPSGAGGPI